MPWHGIWFEHEADVGKGRSPEPFQGLVPPTVYPYAHGFIEAEEARLRKSRDPSTVRIDGETFRVFYSINHDGGLTGVHQQGCHILAWLFGHFATKSPISARFSEIPIIIHADQPEKAAALGNALALLRFLNAAEDQAIAKIMIHPWNPLAPSPVRAAQEYERRALEFLHGEVFYPEGIGLFDVLDRRDLRGHREMPPCCKTQIGFIESILEWVDECWPTTPAERAELSTKLARSLADEAEYLRKRAARGAPRPSAMETFR